MRKTKNLLRNMVSRNWVWWLACFVGSGAAAEQVVFDQVVLKQEKKFTTLQHESRKLEKIKAIGGARYWPWLFLSDTGAIDVGGLNINTRTGKAVRVSTNKNALSIGNGFVLEIAGSEKLQLSKGNKSCDVRIDAIGNYTAATPITDLLQFSYLYFVSADTYLVALSRHLNEDGDPEYRTSRVDFPTCTVTPSSRIEKQDYFVDIGWTKKGGWWLVGSIEQTLLRSDDGLKWHDVSLPETTSALLSAYAKTDREIWIAARIDPQRVGQGPMLAISDDGGTSWRELTFESNELEKVPYYWLEGRVRAQSIQKQRKRNGVRVKLN